MVRADKQCGYGAKACRVLLALALSTMASSCTLIERVVEIAVDKAEQRIDAKELKIRSFQATPTSVASGAEVRLEWAVEGADLVTIEPGVGTVASAGNAVVKPSADTTYILEARYGTARKDRQARVAIEASKPVVQNTGTNGGSSNSTASTGGGGSSVPIIRRPGGLGDDIATIDIGKLHKEPIVKPDEPPKPIETIKVDPKPPPKPVELAPIDQLWEVKLTFQGAINQHTSHEASTETYVEFTARMGQSRFRRDVWKDITDKDDPTFDDHGAKRLCSETFTCTVNGEENINYQLLFHDRDGDYHPCAATGGSFRNVFEIVEVDGVAENIWTPTVRWQGDYGDMDFAVAMKITKRRIK